MASALRASYCLLVRSAQRSQILTGLAPAAAPGRIALPAYAAARSFSKTSVRNEIIKKYSEDHEWISLDTESKIATVGVSNYAQTQLGDVVFVELPAEGTDVKAGDSAGAVESVKQASDIISPVSGTVTEANTALDEKPGQINKDAEGETGWIFKVQVGDDYQAELEHLMDSEAYTTFTKE